MKRPKAITLIAGIFILAGTAGLLSDLWPLVTANSAQQIAKLRADGLADLAPAWGLRLLAIIGGLGLIRGHNWARWLVALWMATHVGISFFHSLSKVLAHCAIFLPILYFLCRPPVRPWFHAPRGSSA